MALTAAQEREFQDIVAAGRKIGIAGPLPQPTGALFGRMAVALSRTMVHGRSVASMIARDDETEHDQVIRAIVGAADSTNAAALLQTELGNVIAELAARVPLLELRASELGMTASSSSRHFPRVATGITGAFIAEGMPIPASAAVFDSILAPALKKWGALIAFTAEVTKSPVGAQAINALFTRSMAKTLNAVSLSANAATAAAPAGLFHSSNATAPIASVDLPTDVNAIAAAMAGLYALDECAWIMSPTTLLKVAGHKTGGVATFTMAGERQLLGARVLESADMPAARIALVHEESVLRSVIIDPAGIELSETASAQLDSTPAADIGGATANVTSAWQMNMFLARCIGWATWLTERTSAIQQAVVAW